MSFTEALIFVVFVWIATIAFGFAVKGVLDALFWGKHGKR